MMTPHKAGSRRNSPVSNASRTNLLQKRYAKVRKDNVFYRLFRRSFRLSLKTSLTMISSDFTLSKSYLTSMNLHPQSMTGTRAFHKRTTLERSKLQNQKPTNTCNNLMMMTSISAWTPMKHLIRLRCKITVMI